MDHAEFAVKFTQKEKLVLFGLYISALLFTAIGGYGLWQGIDMYSHRVTINIEDPAFLLLGLVLFPFANWYRVRCKLLHLIAHTKNKLEEYAKESRSS